MNVEKHAVNLIAEIAEFYHHHLMNAFVLEIEKELGSLEPESARHFERAVREMLLMAKTSQSRTTSRTFSERIVSHPAIGTWPADLDVESHLTKVRNEWGN